MSNDMNDIKKKIWSKNVLVAALLIAIVMAGCILFCSWYVEKVVLEANENSAINSAQIINNNFSITDDEVTYMKSLTFNEMQADSINHRLADVATGMKFTEPIISIYVIAPLDDKEIKYTIDDSNKDFFGAPAGTKLGCVWLLNMAVDEDGKAIFRQRDDIYRYTVTSDEYVAGFKNKKAFGTHMADEWGDVITGYVPLYSEEGNYVGMLGVDFDLSEYSTTLSKTIIVVVCIFLLAIMFFLILFVILYRKYRRTQNAELEKERENLELLENEKTNLATILNNIAIGICVFSIDEDDFRLVQVNDTLGKMIGLEEGDKIVPEKNIAYKYTHPDDIELIKNVIRKLSVSNNVVDYEYRSKNLETGKYMWLEAKGRSVKNPDGSIYAYICFMDVSKQRELKDLENALELEQAASKAKSEFLSNMSHDMRTPMNGILGIINLMQDKDVSEDIRHDLEQLALSSKYLLNLINDTLDLSKIEAHKMTLHPFATDSIEMRENICNSANILANQKDVSFNLIIKNAAEMTHEILNIDGGRVEQIFMNLISNAIKFTPAGGQVSLSIQRLRTTETYIEERFDISDTGIGISPSFMNHMYEPFSQEGRMTIEGESSTGLGLSIVKKIVDIMGAEISVESEIDKGTTFSLVFKFPIYEGDYISNESCENTDISVIKGKHILICEDHPLNRKIAEKLLLKKGAIVDLAENGKECLEKFNDSEIDYYDMILMDMKMPIMDGLEATKEIRSLKREDSCSTPIVAMTANAFDDDVKLCLSVGMNAHIAKPIEPEVMYKIIAKNLK